MHQVNLRYWLNVNTGEVIDSYYQSLDDLRGRIENWPRVLVAISYEVYGKLVKKKEV